MLGLNLGSFKPWLRLSVVGMFIPGSGLPETGVSLLTYLTATFPPNSDTLPFMASAARSQIFRLLD
jgi:hypothetical protein